MVGQKIYSLFAASVASISLHVVAGGLLCLGSYKINSPINQDRNPEEDKCLVTFSDSGQGYEDPVKPVTPDTLLGDKNVNQGKETSNSKTLFLQTGKERTGLSDELESRLADFERQAEESRKEHSKNLDVMFMRLDEICNRIDASFNRIDASLDRIKNTFEQGSKIEALTLSNGNLEKYFSDTYAANNRNEITYSELFRSYGNYWMLRHGKDLSSVQEICKRNPQSKEAIILEVEFAEDGTFRFTKFSMNPMFKDDDKKVERRYREIIEAMPRRFVPLSAANLKAPYRLEYYAINHYAKHSDEDKSDRTQ
jgi:hypothetical protein